MDPSNIHNHIATNSHIASSPTPTIPISSPGQQFYPQPSPYFHQNTPLQQWHQPGFQPQQQGSSPSIDTNALLSNIPPECLTPVRQAMNQIHQLGRTLQVDAQFASIFLFFGKDQFNGLVRKIATEALLSGIYGIRVQVERIKFHNAPDDTLGVQVPVNSAPVKDGQHLDSGPAPMVHGVPNTPPASNTTTTTTTTPSISIAALPNAPPPAGMLQVDPNGAITSIGLNVTWESGPGCSAQPIDLTGDDEPTAIGNTTKFIASSTSPTSQVSPAAPCITSPTSSPNTTNNPESRKRSRDVGAIDLDAPSPNQPPAKKPKGPLSKFRMDGPPVLYERRVENYLIPYVRYYDSRAGTVRDISYEIYTAEYGEMSARWQELQGELEELHEKRRRLGNLLNMEEKGKKSGRKMGKNAGAVFGPVERETSSSSSCSPSSAVTATAETNVDARSAATAVMTDGASGMGKKAKVMKNTKQGTMKGKKTSGAGAGTGATTAATATTPNTTTIPPPPPPQQPASSLPTLSAPMPTPMQFLEEQEYDGDNEFERMCEQECVDDGATAASQAEDGCDGDDDFARMCEAVWDSIDTEEETAVISAGVDPELQQCQHADGDGEEDECLYSGDLIIEDPSHPVQEMLVPAEENEQVEAQQMIAGPVDYNSEEESEEEGGDLPPLYRQFYRPF